MVSNHQSSGGPSVERTPSQLSFESTPGLKKSSELDAASGESCAYYQKV